MKKTTVCLGLIISSISFSQNTVADFESFTLAPNSAYSPTTSTPFQTSNAIFSYDYQFSFWLGGFSYTNKYDSTTASYTNLYGVKALQGYSNSATYVVGQDEGVIKLKTPNARALGFYITNTTYAFKSVRSGDQFSRKFGDTTGTHSPTTVAQGSYPDFFKVTAKGYRNGSIKSDSSVFYLADYRFASSSQDYVVSDWRWFDLSNLGLIDSVQFFMYSSDNSNGFMNTPAFFGMDNFTTAPNNPVGINESKSNNNLIIYPNPFSEKIYLDINTDIENEVKVFDMCGKLVFNGIISSTQNEINTKSWEAGIYFFKINDGKTTSTKKIIKQD